MMTKINISKSISSVLLLISLFFTVNLNAQCPNQDDENKLKSQADVDAFLADNPDCTHLFELELSGDISDISGFSTLTSVEFLYIEDCPNLTDISAFSNIDSIFGHLGFDGTEGLTSACGFDNLVFIGRDLRVWETVSMQNLDGLENVVFIGDDISIEENQNLENLDGIKNASMVSGTRINLLDNPSLTNCCGIQHLIENTEDLSVNIQNTPSFCSSTTEILEADCSFPSSSCITNVDEQANIDIELFPNPASDYLEIRNAESLKIDGLVMYNSIGQVVHQVIEPRSIVNIDFLENGLYTVEIQTGNLSTAKKIVIQK
ncbi:MAG: T9SS type A sorting domain-containing protein [Bacteroidota bacterium]